MEATTISIEDAMTETMQTLFGELDSCENGISLKSYDSFNKVICTIPVGCADAVSQLMGWVVYTICDRKPERISARKFADSPEYEEIKGYSDPKNLELIMNAFDDVADMINAYVELHNQTWNGRSRFNPFTIGLAAGRMIRLSVQRDDAPDGTAHAHAVNVGTFPHMQASIIHRLCEVIPSLSQSSNFKDANEFALIVSDRIKLVLCNSEVRGRRLTDQEISLFINGFSIHGMHGLWHDAQELLVGGLNCDRDDIYLNISMLNINDIESAQYL